MTAWLTAHVVGLGGKRVKPAEVNPFTMSRSKPATVRMSVRDFASIWCK